MCISFNFSIGVDVNEREFTVHQFTCPGIKVRTTLLLFKISKSLCDYRMKFHLTLRRVMMLAAGYLPALLEARISLGITTHFYRHIPQDHLLVMSFTKYTA